jgi:hypothetical protein
MIELGQILSNLVNIVPDGMVVFFPSYSFLNALRIKWKEAGILDRLAQKKTVCKFVAVSICLNMRIRFYLSHKKEVESMQSCRNTRQPYGRR